MSKQCLGRLVGLKVLGLAVYFVCTLCFLASCGDESSNSADPKYEMHICDETTEGTVDSLDGIHYICNAGEWLKLPDSTSADSLSTDSLKQKEIVVGQDSAKIADPQGQDSVSVDTLTHQDTSKVTSPDTSEKSGKEPVLLEKVKVSGAFSYGIFDSRATVAVEALDESFKSTGTSFPATISAAEGTYTASNVSFTPPYARAYVQGKAVDLVRGGTTQLKDTLYALVATSGKNGHANINVLTYLKSVYMQSLLKKSGSTTETKASEKASGAVWKMFNFDADSLGHVDSVTSIVVNEPNAAALLAATIMMQSLANDTVANLWKVASDFADGSWDDSLARAKIADWAFNEDVNDDFETVLKNVERLGLGIVPPFEKYIRMFYRAELGLDACSDENVGTIFFSKNPFSAYYASELSDVSVTSARFICDKKTKTWREADDEEKDTYGFGKGTDGEIRQGQVNAGNLYSYNATSDSWRADNSALAINTYFVNKSNITDFVDLQTVYESIKPDERVIFLLRHAQRDQNATSKEDGLSKAGLDSSKAVGSRLTKFNEPMRLGASEFYRAQQTVIGIAMGRGQDTTISDTIPELNDNWYMIDRQLVNQAESEAGGGWEATSYYTYTGRYSGDTARIQAYYNLENRSAQLIELLYNKYKDEPDRFIMLSSHDKLMVPFVAYCSKLRINMNVTPNGGGTWINYFAGIAIIWDKSGNRRYVAFKGLKDAYFQGW